MFGIRLGLFDESEEGWGEELKLEWRERDLGGVLYTAKRMRRI